MEVWQAGGWWKNISYNVYQRYIAKLLHMISRYSFRVSLTTLPSLQHDKGYTVAPKDSTARQYATTMWQYRTTRNDTMCHVNTSPPLPHNCWSCLLLRVISCCKGVLNKVLLFVGVGQVVAAAGPFRKSYLSTHFRLKLHFIDHSLCVTLFVCTSHAAIST